MSDPYIHANGCLKNKLRITDPEKLESAERQQTRNRLDAIDKEGPKSQIGWERMKATHAFIFQDVYAWAGEPRTTPLGKAAFEGGRASWFTPPESIESEARALFGQLNTATGFKGLDRKAFAIKAADFMADLNAIHPFR